MSMQTVLNNIEAYGYIVIALSLFFGIVGIPAPEESLLFFIGVLVVHHKLAFGQAVMSAIFGAFIGMLTAYVCGKYVGYPFIKKFGKYIGITDARWEKAKDKYTNHARKTILFGFYMPGIRQISPYFAGITNIPFRSFFVFSLMGSILWIIPSIAAGYFAGRIFHINPAYVPYLGLFFLVLFVIYVLFK
ncbi:MAG TPA: DedA family protein, partial [Bacillales bacterium]|nr:DedA family protein [Bacillales bacterium]